MGELVGREGSDEPNDGADVSRSERARVRPRVSVVVASCRERELLEDCLEALLPQCRRCRAEVVIARPEDRDDLELIREDHPDLHLEPAPPGSSVPQLRAVGMAATSGDIVALTEDHCVVAPGWLEAMVEAHGRGDEVVGGAMANARRERAVDWAAFFAEYGLFAEGADGGRDQLTGANVSYGPDVVERVVDLARQGEWENVIHERLLAAGSTVHFLRSAAVRHNRSWDVPEFCRDRYLHGRGYARRRLVEEPGRARWLYLAGTPLLPFLLAGRIARSVPAGDRAAFLRALPATLLFLAAWSVGEAAGYLAGPEDEASGGADG